MNVIKPDKLIRTNKDLVFWTMWTMWLVTNFIVASMSKYVTISNLVFIVLFIVLILLKSYNTKFADWLIKER